MPYEHLPHAPITEAILDVRVRSRPNLSAAEFRELTPQLKPELPVVGEMRHVTASFQFGPGAIPGSSGTTPASRSLAPWPTAANLRQGHGLDGLLFKSQDGKDVAQFRVDGFSLNRLAPYQDWDHWFPRFKRLWAAYVQVARPVAAVRIAARCINQFPVQPGTRLEDYLTAPPATPAGLPQNLRAFQFRTLVTDDAMPGLSLGMVQALHLGPDGRTLQLVLDIDAFSVGEFSLDNVLNGFEPLHELRNRAFFRSLTPATIARFRG
jgi:uncharacterized protein (TIGR04255 family)